MRQVALSAKMDAFTPRQQLNFEQCQPVKQLAKIWDMLHICSGSSWVGEGMTFVSFT